MRKIRKIECKDCHEIFESFAVNAVRCKKCQRKHKNECEKLRKRELSSYIKNIHKEKKESCKTSEIEFLNLADPWSEGRLPKSVTENQLWSMP